MPHTSLYVADPHDQMNAGMANLNPTDFGPRMNEAFLALRPVLVGQNELLVQAMFAIGAIEHVLWVAGPGVAKSMAAQLIMSLFPDAEQLRLQITKDMPQEAIFGHLVAKDLIEKGEENRNIEGGLADVHFFYADEIMDGSAWTLRSMLNVILERKLRSKQGDIDAPLHSVIATTNFFRSSGELEAVVDRFLARAMMPAATSVAHHYRIGRGYTRTSGRQFVQPTLNYADLLAFSQWIESPDGVNIPNSMMLMHYVLMLEFLKRRHKMAVDQWANKQGVDMSDPQNAKNEPTARDLGVYITPRTAAKALDFIKVGAGIDGRSEVLPNDLRAAGMVYCVLNDGTGSSELWNEVCNEFLNGLGAKELDVLSAIGSLVDFVGELGCEKGMATQGEFIVGGKTVAVTRATLLQVRASNFGFKKPHRAIARALEMLDECIADLDTMVYRTGIIVPGWS